MAHKIVLIEDDSALLDMYKIKFSESGFELFTASNGEEGLALIQKEKPELALVDIMMPKMDGFAVLKVLRQDPATKDMPVLLLTNLGQKSDIDKGKELGATDYIVKASMTPAQVVEQIKKHIKI